MTRKTNTEFITDLTEFSPYGAVAQVLIMTAIERFAEAAAEKRIPDDGLVHPDAWQGCAKDIVKRFKQHYEEQ